MRLLLRNNRPKQALFWARFPLAVSRVLPTWRCVANINMAACYLTIGDYVAALPYAEKAVAHYEDAHAPRYRSVKALASAYLGIALLRGGQIERAEKLLDAALNLGTLRPAYRDMTESAAAGVYIQRGRLTEAKRLLESLLARPKVNPDIRLNSELLLAGCLSFQEDYPAALAILRKAKQQKTKLDWLSALADALLTNCLTEAEEFREAQELEAPLLLEAPEMPSHIQAAILRASANLALKTDRLDRAREQAERAAALDPTPNAQAGSMLTQAEVFAARQNAQRAMSLTDAILRSDAIDFYKNRARALQARIAAPVVPMLQEN